MRDHTSYAGLADRVVLITGGASGIGAAFVRAFAAQRARVAFLDVDAEAGEALVREVADASGSAPLFVPCDLLDIEALRFAMTEVRAALGDAAVLVNNAANDQRQVLSEVTPEEFDWMIGVNLKHVFFAAQAVVPQMQARGGGSIVNMSSAASSVKGAALRCIYGTTKAAVIGLTKSVAVDYVAKGVRCNAICPGTVQTPSLDERIASLGGGPDAKKFFLQRQPAGRFGAPEEIAALAVYLASDDSAFTTGTVNVIDGGWSV